MVVYRSLRLAPRCLASTLVIDVLKNGVRALHAPIVTRPLQKSFLRPCIVKYFVLLSAERAFLQRIYLYLSTAEWVTMNTPTCSLSIPLSHSYNWSSPTYRLALFPDLHVPSFYCLQCEMKAGSGRGWEEANTISRSIPTLAQRCPTLPQLCHLTYCVCIL